jgi:hypothetical protein
MCALSTTVPKPSPEVVYRRLGEAGVLVHLETNHVFEINATGLRVWELVQEGRSVSGIVDALTREFQIDQASARTDVDQLLDELLARGLLVS